MLSELQALEEINTAPRRVNELRLKDININDLIKKGLVKEENGWLYLTDAGIKRLLELYGILDSLLEIYINMSSDIKTKISEIDERVLNSGLVEIKGDYVELNFEGIKLIAQRIAEKMSRAH